MSTLTPAALAEARRLAEEASSLTTGQWRVGRKLARTLYAVIGPEPNDKDWLLGLVDHPEVAAFIAHCNPAFVLELVREIERLREVEALANLEVVAELRRLRRVEEAARPIIERHAEQIRRLTAGMPDEVAGTYLAEVEAADAALANPAAEDITIDSGGLPGSVHIPSLHAEEGE